MRRLLFLALLLLVSSSAFALRIEDGTVIVPIIGRFAGIPPSLWRTDVFIANPYSPAAVVTLNFYQSGGATLTASVTVGAFSSVTLRDIVLNTFGREVAAGQLELKTSGSIEARARIYNQGLAVGEFAQSAPGIGFFQLRRQGLIHGLSGIGGNRVNIGIANPNGSAITGTLRIADKDNNTLSSTQETIEAHQTRQFNDIFTTFGIAPRADVTVHFNTFETVHYLYASEVRNDTGDAIFLFGTSPNS